MGGITPGKMLGDGFAVEGRPGYCRSMAPTRVDLPGCPTVICHRPIRLTVAPRSVTLAIFRSCCPPATERYSDARDGSQ
jgi:hypothetical protein